MGLASLNPQPGPVPAAAAAAAIISAVTDLCLGLDMTTTAEGVETEAQFEALLRKGCAEAQGYHYGRPMSEEQFLEWLQVHQKGIA